MNLREKCGVWEVDLEMVVSFCFWVFFFYIRDYTSSVLTLKDLSEATEPPSQHITWCGINKCPEGCHGFPRLGHPGLENINKLLP